MKVETLAVHAGAAPDPSTGAVAPPIVLSTTFEHGPASESLHGFTYIREDNPTQARLEEALKAIEGGEAALAFASGMAAGTSYLQALPAGAHVVFQDDLYYDFRNVAREFLPRWGMTSSAVDMGDLEAVRAALKPETKLVWLETPSNPLMRVCDIGAITGMAHAVGARVLVDGTFAPPTIQRPLDLGVDAVLHSTTKYLGGHSDVQGGALVMRKKDDLYEGVRHARKVLGGVASPFNSWLVLRGLRSLGCRVERHCANALQVAQALATHPSVAAVHYPGLTSHPGTRGGPPADEGLRRHALVPGEGRTRRRRRGRVAGAPLHPGHQPRGNGEPHRAPALVGGPDLADTGRPPARLRRPRARRRPRRRPAARAGARRPC